MAACTQSLKVLFGMSTTFGERQLMMNFLSRDISPVLKAQFTEGMPGYVQVPDGTPAAVVLLLNIRIVAVGTVKIAVTVVGYIGTTWVAAGFGGFVGHR